MRKTGAFVGWIEMIEHLGFSVQNSGYTFDQFKKRLKDLKDSGFLKLIKLQVITSQQTIYFNKFRTKDKLSMTGNFVIPNEYHSKIRVFSKYSNNQGWILDPKSVTRLDNCVHVDIYCGYPTGFKEYKFLIELDPGESFDESHSLNLEGLAHTIKLFKKHFVLGTKKDGYSVNTGYLTFCANNFQDALNFGIELTKIPKELFTTSHAPDSKEITEKIHELVNLFKEKEEQLKKSQIK